MNDLLTRLLALAELAVSEALVYEYGDPEDRHIWRELQELKPLVATALAQPEPEGATNEELDDARQVIRLSHIIQDAFPLASLDAEHIARVVLACWGRPAIEPVPVSERPWERKGWCDAEGRCYGWDGDYWWMIGNPEAADETITHWLPHHALPVPRP